MKHVTTKLCMFFLCVRPVWVGKRIGFLRLVVSGVEVIEYDQMVSV